MSRNITTAFATYNGIVPIDGPKYLQTLLTFTGGVIDDVGLLDILYEQLTKQIPYVQSVYIDNADNATNFELIIRPSGQRIIARANSQGWYDAMAGDQLRFDARLTTAVNGSVRLGFQCAPISANVWSVV